MDVTDEMVDAAERRYRTSEQDGRALLRDCLKAALDAAPEPEPYRQVQHIHVQRDGFSTDLLIDGERFPFSCLPDVRVDVTRDAFPTVAITLEAMKVTVENCLPGTLDPELAGRSD